MYSTASMSRPARKQKIGVVSLGCPKNLVDSEVMLGLLQKDGYELTPNEDEADVMIVNTCAFVEDAKKESIDAILDLAHKKKKGSIQKLVVTGCLAQRYQKELEHELPEVDHFLGTGEFQHIAEVLGATTELPVAKSMVNDPEFVYDYATPRLMVLPEHTAYVKIAEGCSRTCSFCIIPKLRGPGRSRSIESIVKEVERLAESGALEINLIAQDLTAYGVDLKDGTNLEKLLRELVKIPGPRWIRLLYSYPMFFSDSLIELISENEKICSYLDIPLQHIDSKLLATMRRYVNEDEIRGLLRKLRNRIPGLTLRTTLIVGFPGETEEQFQKLLRFVEETEFDRLGAFAYSQEEGTPAGEMPNQLDTVVKQSRLDHLMRLQQPISQKRNESYLGKTMEILVDRKLEEKGEFQYVGRTEGQALDIDGSVFLKAKKLKVGSMVKAKIEGASEYDLFGCA